MFNGANTGFMLLAASLVMLMTPGLAFFYCGPAGRSHPLLILVVWQLAVYCPFVHMFWGGGVLAHWGARDFAGGIVVHASAGWAALASVLYVGKRKYVDLPHNIPFIALGTGLLWFGWYGFNAGSELKVDDITATAFLNTDIAASFAAVTWLFVEWWYAKKPHFVGLLTGAVAGLATITPAAG